MTARWAGRLRNAYGPTETTVIATITAPLGDGDPVTIGSPLRGVSAMILDSRLRPVPRGVAGDLYLAGPGVARGYHARRGGTSERFVPNPFGVNGSRMYHTGDVVRWSRVHELSAHRIEFVGRGDFQVKVRGFRVELGEIDAALTRQDGVDFAVTVGVRGQDADTALASYVRAEPGFTLDVDALRDRKSVV